MFSSGAAAAAYPIAGFPDATNTGVPSGTVLTNSGSITVSTPGALISALNVTGSITVTASNVTIQNCKVNGSGADYCIGMDSALSIVNLTVLNCELFAVSNGIFAQSHCRAGVATFGQHDGLEVHHCNIYGMENGIENGSGYIHDNYIHDFQSWTVGADETHDDCIQTFGFSGAGGQRIIHNTFYGQGTSGDRAPEATSSCYAGSTGMFNVTFNNNLFAGGGWTIYGTQDGSGSGWVITNNHFSRLFYTNCGFFGTDTGLPPGTVWTGNVWHETGLPA